MIKKVKIELMDDFISCGINTDYNFLVSEDYISGAVIRAAFAKDIYLGCEIENRDYFIETKDEGVCDNCPKRDVCKKFSDMTFSFFYPENTIPSPMTVKKCKLYPNEHPIKDILLSGGVAICEECRKQDPNAGRMEDAKGYIDLTNKKPCKIKHNITTHTAINYTTRTAKNGSLFTIDSIAKGQIYEGYIDDCESGLLKEGTTVYAGKYSSNGYGKIKIMEISDACEETDILQKIKSFTASYGGDGNRYYFPMLFLSYGRLGIEPDTPPMTTEKYKETWARLLFGENSLFRVETVYAKQRVYRGYDTSEKWGEWEKDAVVETLPGSSVCLSFDENDMNDAVNTLKDILKNGVGADTKNGYGKVDICNDLQMIGVDENGNR